LLRPETRANPMRINEQLPTAQEFNFKLDSIYTQLEDSTQTIMKWQIALGLLLCAALAVAVPSQEEKAMAERVLEETLSNLDEPNVSEEKAMDLKKKIFRVRVHIG
ncbi:hypothetical protein BOX15_Mlig033597g1, partial [Macrostomum lignano]